VLWHGADSPPAGFFAFDPGKIVMITKRTALTGPALAEILREEHKIEIEMSRPDYAVAMTSIGDKPQGFQRLAEALQKVDREHLSRTPVPRHCEEL
jgi:arginine/lysine/ornithine decarboxylase